MPSQAQTAPPETYTAPHAAFAMPLGRHAEIRRYFGTPADIDQPPAPEDVICFHLGGAKRVTRRQEGRESFHNVPFRALTVIPRERGSRWHTVGPIDYAHLLFKPDFLADIALSEFGREGAGLELHDAIGFEDALLGTIFTELLDVASGEEQYGPLYVESLLTCFAIALLRKHSSLCGHNADSAPATQRGGMPGWRLTRVIDYMTAHIADDPELDEIADVAGLSRSQFFRAFKQAAGETPARYFDQLRIDTAKTLLVEHGRNCDEVAEAVGLHDRRRLRRTFLRCTGMTPSTYRTMMR